jgi:NADPH:quinone reductase-like Zn-dependent oxidoreductase
MPRILQYVMFGKWISRRYHKHIRVLGLKPNQGLAHLTDLVESGKMIAMIDGSYQLIDAIDAIQHFAAAKHKGKVVISMVSDTLSDD